MGTDVKIDVYERRPDNSDFALTYDELPNRYEPSIMWYKSYDGQHCRALFLIFQALLEKKGKGHDYVRNYVKFTSEDFPFLFEELEKIPDSELDDEDFTKEQVREKLKEWQADATNWQADFYFFWC